MLRSQAVSEGECCFLPDNQICLLSEKDAGLGARGELGCHAPECCCPLPGGCSQTRHIGPGWRAQGTPPSYLELGTRYIVEHVWPLGFAHPIKRWWSSKRGALGHAWAEPEPLGVMQEGITWTRPKSWQGQLRRWSPRALFCLVGCV